MSEMRLEEGKINLEGKWLSSEELTNMIKEKMQAGDMKFSNIAAALEELNSAMEKAQIMDVKFVITKEEYSKLKELGGEDDSEIVRKAVLGFISQEDFDVMTGEQAEKDSKGYFLG